MNSGNLIVIAGTTLAIIGLTWGGTRYPWDSAHVLAPLIIGLVLLGLFVVYEAYVPKVPTIPFRTLNNSTTISGYVGHSTSPSSVLISGVVDILAHLLMELRAFR